MSLPTLHDITEDLAILPDWESRYTYLIDLARNLPPMPEADKTEANKVRGCTSQVWLTHSWSPEGAMNLQLDSDAIIVKGLLALAYAAYNGQTPQAISGLNLAAQLEHSGLLNNLSPNRRNGFASVISRIRSLAEEKAA